MTNGKNEKASETWERTGRSIENEDEIGQGDKRTDGVGCQALIITNKYGLLGKAYLLADGAIVTDKGAGVMSDGSYEVVDTPTLAAWNARLNMLTSAQGVVTGVPVPGYALKGRILSRERLEFLLPGAREGIITRSQDHLHWREGAPTLLCIDVDRAEGCMSCTDLDAVTREAVPELGDTRVLWRSSGSSLLRVRGVEGWARPFKAHGWIIISDGGYSRAVCACIRDRLAPHGVVVDTSVTSPEHWAFAQPATYAKGIIVPPRDVLMTGSVDVFDVRSLVQVEQPVVVAEVKQPVVVAEVTLSDSERRRYEAILRLKMNDVEAFAAAPEGERHHAQNGLVVKLAPFVREGLLAEAELRALVEDAAIRNGYLADVGAHKWEAEFDKSLREGMDMLELQPLRPEITAAQVFGAPGAPMMVEAAVAPADNAATIRNWHARVCAGERSMPDWEALGTPEGAEAFDGLAWAGLKEFRRQVDAERKRLHKAAKRAEFANSADGIVQYMNGKYAFICDRGGKSFVMWTNDEGETKFKTVHDFKDMECKHNLVIDDKKVSYAKLWLEHPQRREYDGVVFDPSNKSSDKYYNTWTGLVVEPKQGCWSLLDRHVYNVLSCKDDSSYQFILRHAAWCLQNPHRAAEIAVVLRGGQGAGKGFWCSLLNSLFGKHGYETADTNDLVGSFTGHLETCCFLFLDEVRPSKNPTDEDKINHYITSKQLRIHPKGAQIFQVPNRLKIVMATNRDWITPIEKKDRRFAIFDVSEEHAQSKPYFNALRKEMDNGGIEAFLYDMLNMDLGDWHPRWNIPATKAKIEQAERSLSIFDDWMLDILESGCLPGSSSPGVALSSGLLNDLNKLRKTPYPLNVFGKDLKKYGAEPKRIGAACLRVWAFPSLDACRARWDAIHGARDWPDASWEDSLGISPELPVSTGPTGRPN